MKRQAMEVTIDQLDNLRIELIDLQFEECEKLGLEEDIDYERKHQVGIINKTPKCSDTWELEEGSS